LSKAAFKNSPANFIFEGKKIRGLWVQLWIESLGVEGRQQIAEKIIDRLKNEFKTDVETVFPLEDFEKALAYHEDSGHHEKILLKLN
jgi:NADPH:quinone reductase-like Zn-dependent oxidoreductase